MKYAILALALLISPAQAAPLDQGGCLDIQYMFEACTSWDPPECHIVHRFGAGESKSIGTFYDKYPDVDGDKIEALCHEVCKGKTTVLSATRKFCPWYKPDHHT
ncbi:hypothetical protein [Bradyrhizobium sp. 144]|uniref:hypothetical protein n=1 Tax=Bradyrhizobium sp. 144 TaxID=2782620 RepID=UPI001FFAB1B0|nr:hypothetical protein [Bradyrhizobium sp. 144]MCK1693095.1 hypothetical protein [Bradyrhizobium sp. 144]